MTLLINLIMIDAYHFAYYYSTVMTVLQKQAERDTPINQSTYITVQ